MRPNNRSFGRTHVRLRLIPPILGHLRIEATNGKPAPSKEHPVLVINLSPSGLRMLTHLKFPVASHYILGIELQLLQVQLELRGCVMWRTEEENLYEYGIQLIQSDAERILLSKLLHDYLRTILPRQQRIHRLYNELLRTVTFYH
ncbi:MAG TPA: PilZ domain-containing protein [Paenibacillus sp.]|jgi:hypothetical protein